MTAVTIMVWVSLALLVAALILAIYRLALGPNALDRAVAVDVFSAAVIAVVVILIVYRGRSDLRALLIVFVLTAFFSTVSVSRFIMVGRRRKPRGPVVSVFASSDRREGDSGGLAGESAVEAASSIPDPEELGETGAVPESSGVSRREKGPSGE